MVAPRPGGDQSTPCEFHPSPNVNKTVIMGEQDPGKGYRYDTVPYRKSLGWAA
ncbi:hypothetical protein SUDANB176_02224 [Streptomyces sp. enrichment culture]